MEKIIIKEVLGKEIFSRENIKNIYNIITPESRFIDFVDVTFISRSAVDELFNILKGKEEIELINIHPEIKVMMEVVKRGRRGHNRNFNHVKVSTTYFCNNMNEVKEALLSR